MHQRETVNSLFSVKKVNILISTKDCYVFFSPKICGKIEAVTHGIVEKEVSVAFAVPSPAAQVPTSGCETAVVHRKI